MKRILAFILLVLLLLLPLNLYAEGEDQVDEGEQVVEEEVKPEEKTGEEPTETENRDQEGETTQTEEVGQEGEATQTEETSQEEATQIEETEQEGKATQPDETSQEEATQTQDVGEEDLPEMFVVMDEDGALISSSGAGYEIGLSSMETLLLMAALDEKYGQADDMGTLKVGEDFEAPYGGGLDIIAGEEFRALDLYKALFLKSPADAGLLFALRDFGGEELVLSSLSALATKIGLTSTTIDDLYGEASISTPYDVAKLFLYNYNHSNRFREAIGLNSLDIEGTEMTAARQLTSSSALVLDTGMTVLHKGEERKVFDGGVMAGKTAYANDGSYIMLSLFKAHGRPLVFVSSGNQALEEAYQRHKALQDRIVEGYELVSYLKVGTTIKAFKAGGEDGQGLDMSPKADVFLLLPKNYDVKTKIENRYQADSQGGVQIAIYKEGALYKTVPALSSTGGEGDSYLGEVRTVEDEKKGRDKALDILKIIFKLFFSLVLWLLFVAFNRWRIRSAKRKERSRTRSH